jgi:hypothetical protein
MYLRDGPELALVHVARANSYIIAPTAHSNLLSFSFFDSRLGFATLPAARVSYALWLPSFGFLWAASDRSGLV